MPWTGTRSTILLIGTAIGLAGSGSAQAGPQGRPDESFVLAQKTQQQTDQQEEERKRRQKVQQEQQDRQQHQQDQHNRGDQQFNQGDRGNAGHDRVLRDQADKERKLREEAEKDRKLRDDADKERKRLNAEKEKEFRLKEQADKDRERLNAEKERQLKLKERADKERERLNGEKDRQLKLKEQADKERNRLNAEKDRQLKLKEQADKDRERLREKGSTGSTAADRRERFDEKLKDRAISRTEREEFRKQRLQFSREKLQDIARQRHERREGNRIIIEEPDSRRIVKDQGKIIIRHDELARLRAPGVNIHVEHDSRGGNRTVIIRPGGVQIITIQDSEGRLIKRIKRFPNGREVILINNDYHRDRYRDRDRDHRGFGFFITLPAFVPDVPEHDYYIYADEADEDEMEQILSAPPLEDLTEDYSLDEIRYSPDIRKRFRKLNLNITFEFGSWEVRDAQIEKLASVGTAIQHILERNPDEMFLVAGHTDAVGLDEDNLSLSDRRAEAVARVLTDEYGVPPENLVTQGYGESELLVPTSEPEERNRRVEIMRITNYLAQKD